MNVLARLKRRLVYNVMAIATICLLITFTFLVIASHKILKQDFVELEEQTNRVNMHRLIAFLDDQADNLVSTLGDWGAWDDTRDFVLERQISYIEDNLNSGVYSNLGVDVMLFADNSRNIVWSKVNDPRQGILVDTPRQISQYLLETENLWQHSTVDDRKVGFLTTTTGTIFLASGPVVNSSMLGPVSGTLILAQFIDDHVIKTLSEQLHLDINIRPSTHPLHIQDPHKVKHLSHTEISVDFLSERKVQTTVSVLDLSRLDGLEFSFISEPKILQRGLATIHFFIYSLFCFGLMIMFFAVYLLKKTVVLPIERLHHEVSTVTDLSSFTYRLEVIGSEELRGLRIAINSMLESLCLAHTQQAKTTDELIQTQTQLMQSSKLASIGELAAGVAHELNQPLMIIRGFGQMLARNCSAEKWNMADIAVHVEMLNRNTERMMQIIEHLLVFSRKPEVLHKQSANINETIENCMLLAGEQLKEYDIEIILSLKENIPPVVGDTNQIEQVLLNLIMNAKNAILEKKNGTGVISISTEIEDLDMRTVLIYVTDNGPGISANIIDRIFDPFFTTSEPGCGTGLGLSISYAIIKRQKGLLSVHQTGISGTTFVIRLPVSSDDERNSV